MPSFSPFVRWKGPCIPRFPTLSSRTIRKERKKWRDAINYERQRDGTTARIPRVPTTNQSTRINEGRSEVAQYFEDSHWPTTRRVVLYARFSRPWLRKARPRLIWKGNSSDRDIPDSHGNYGWPILWNTRGPSPRLPMCYNRNPNLVVGSSNECNMRGKWWIDKLVWCVGGKAQISGNNLLSPNWSLRKR